MLEKLGVFNVANSGSRGNSKGWREYMNLTHKECLSLAKDGIIDIEQKKTKISDFENFKGIYRIRKGTK